METPTDDELLVIQKQLAEDFLTAMNAELKTVQDKIEVISRVRSLLRQQTHDQNEAEFQARKREQDSLLNSI